MKNGICLFVLVCSLSLPFIGFSQSVIREVPLSHEQIVMNDKVGFTMTGIRVADSIQVSKYSIKPKEGAQLVVVTLTGTGTGTTKFVLRPNDFIAMYGDISVYMIPSVAVNTGGYWITNEFEENLGKMSVTTDVTPGILKGSFEVAFRLPKNIVSFSVMCRKISSIGNITIPK
jgi:hypothetical protein